MPKLGESSATNRPTMPPAAINTKRTTQLSICGSTPENDFAEPTGRPLISLRDELSAFQRGLIVVFDSDHTELNRIRAAKRPVVPSAKLG
jgi:hypothetical protein